MKKLLSKQLGVQFIFCESPITIDKRGAWGDNPDNFQKGPNGAFLKTDAKGNISHLVQPNADNTAPIGWIPSTAVPVVGHYDKKPIWITNELIEPGAVLNVKTLDGDIEYKIEKPSRVCYNSAPDGTADLNDVWVQTVEALIKNYEYDV